MELSQKDFQILDTLDSHEIETQRQLAEHTRISLGQVNYVLKSLLDKGLVKIGKFRKNPHKFRYVYLLTPKGVEAKSKLAVNFVLGRLNKYHSLRKKLARKLSAVEEKGNSRILFVGPWMIHDLIGSVVREMQINIELVEHISHWKDLTDHANDSFDIVLIFDSDIESFKKISARTGIPREKFQSLW